MQDFVSDWITDLGTIYQGFLSNFISNLFTTIFLIFLIRIVYEIVTMIFPGIKNLVYTIFKPFRLLHIWFHIQAAKNINAKSHQENPQRGKKVDFSVLFSTGMGSGSEHSIISIVSTDELTTKDAMAVAKAPLKPALVMLLSLIMIGPLMTEGIFVFVHLYFLIGVTLVMFPSGHDNLFVFNTILTKTNLSAWYLIFPFIAFSLTTMLYSFKYQLLNSYPPFWWVEPFVMGLYSTWLYLILLALVVWLTAEKDSPVPQIESTASDKDTTRISIDKKDIQYLRKQHTQNQLRDFWKQT